MSLRFYTLATQLSRRLPGISPLVPPPRVVSKRTLYSALLPSGKPQSLEPPSYPLHTSTSSEFLAAFKPCELGTRTTVCRLPQRLDSPRVPKSTKDNRFTKNPSPYLHEQVWLTKSPPHKFTIQTIQTQHHNIIVKVEIRNTKHLTSPRLTLEW